MRINHFSTYTNGGAGIAAKRIHLGLREIGIDSHFVFKPTDDEPLDEEAQANDSFFHPITYKPNWDIPLLNPVLVELRRRKTRLARRMYRRHLRDRENVDDVFSTPRAFQTSYLSFPKLASDIVHLHWISFFVDYPTFFASLPSRTPIVWTLHDMNPFTGGCHYSGGCGGFEHGCGDCPMIQASGPSDASHDAFRLKKRLMKNRDLHIVTPSRWLGELAQRSPIFSDKTSFHVIPYGLDTEEFFPIDKQQARHELGLPTDATLIGFGAESIDHPRKGFAQLKAALGRLDTQKEIAALLFGSREPDSSQSLGMPVFESGYVTQPKQRRLVYSAMDFFVLPSLEDNQPQTGLESLACGTPVVAFDAGGIPEYVIREKTGLLATVGNVQELADQIKVMIEHAELREQLSQNGRTLIEDEFDLYRQAKDYAELYESIFDGKPDRKPISWLANK